MATSGSKSIAIFGNNQLNLVFKWWVNSDGQSIANNTTLVYWEMLLVSGSEGHLKSSAKKDYSVTVDGDTWTGTNTVGIGNNATKKLASGSKTVTHNSDGTKSFNYSFSQKIAITRESNGEYIGTKSGTGTGTLDTIPRVSKPSCITYPETTKNVGDIGSSFRIHMNRATNEFTHYVYAKWGTKTVEIGKDVTNNIDWKIPENFANEIPNATSGIGTIYVDTYSGSTKIGSASVGFTATVPSSYKPSVSALTAVEAVSSVAEKVGALVKGLSKLKITATGAGSYGSTIKSYKITANGATYNSASITTGLLQSSGTLTIKAQVTDSRGRVGEKSITVTVYNYDKPRIDNCTVARCDKDGTLNEDGTYVKITVKGSITTVNGKNTGTVKFYFKASGASAYSSVELKSNFTTVNESFIKDGYNTELSYNTYVELKDDFNTTTKTANVSTVFTLIDFHKDGKGISFGKVAQFADLFDVNMPAIFQKGYNAVLLEKGTNFNDIMSPNVYHGTHTLGENGTANYLNAPSTVNASFALEVIPAGKSGQLIQRVTTCSKAYSEKWERHYHTSAWGEWVKVYGTTELWSGAFYMQASHTIKLNEAISKQPTGIVLVFSRYDTDNSAELDDDFSSHFVSKKLIADKLGKGHSFFMSDAFFRNVGAKYLTINDTQISGHAANVEITTSSGITFNNKKWVLRYVLGV